MSLDAQAILPRHFYLVLKLRLIKTQLRIDHLALHMLQHAIFLLSVKIAQRNQKIQQQHPHYDGNVITHQVFDNLAPFETTVSKDQHQ